MVAKIETGAGIRGALSYNENKVTDGEAILISAVNYPKNAENLCFHEKLKVLQNRADLHETAEHKCAHIILSFDPSERFSDEKFEIIAREYMNQIGFGDQPYLLYRHKDTVCPHLHIVTTTIRPDGTQFRLRYIGRDVSNPARKRVEQQFGLIPAESKRQQEVYVLKPIELSKIEAGKVPTKTSISNIVRSVFKHYRFTSLPEYNAVLQQFNVIAYRGEPGTLMYENSGLQYCVINKDGKKLTKPIKASSIYDRPIIKELEKKYVKNKHDREEYRDKICRIIDDILKKETSFQGFQVALDRYGICPVLRKNKEGQVYGITYVDNRNLCVFNGSDLGKGYSWKGVSDRLDTVVDSEEQRNTRLVVQEILDGTNFKNGFRNVLSEWTQKGLIVRATKLENGQTSFRLGSMLISPQYYTIADQRMTAYLKANGLTEGRAKFIEDCCRKFFDGDGQQSAMFGDNSNSFSAETFIATINKIVDEALSPVQDYDPISYELLKEARKKKRRRRS